LPPFKITVARLLLVFVSRVLDETDAVFLIGLRYRSRQIPSSQIVV
jgi:hypothetical protein